MKGFNNISRKKILIVTDIVMLCFVVVLMGVYINGRGLNVVVDRNIFPVKGIDISHHNGHVDFKAVKADSVNFVIIKATDGVGDYDSCLVRNYNGARKEGLDVGVYHYFRYHRNGHEQAQYLLDIMKNLKVDPDLPIAIDIENNANRGRDMEEISTNIRDMVEDLRSAGYRTMLYVNLNEYSGVLGRSFDDVDLWLASSRLPSDTVGVRKLWQHSHKGQVYGIEGDVDLNTFNGTVDEYHQWVSIK